MNVAIIGASNDRSKFGNKSLRAHLKRGFTVYPVNLTEQTIEGHQAYRSVLDIRVDLDRISVYIPPNETLHILDEIARKGAHEIFLNPGSENAEVVEKARSLGLNPLLDCSIVNIGESPANY